MKNNCDSRYKFSSCWGYGSHEHWKDILRSFKIEKVLEIGSFEGHTVCFISEIIPKCDFHCIDTWQGDKMLSKQFNFKTIEKNFDNNITLAKKNNPNHEFFKYKKKSYKQLSEFISEGKEEYFDLIYIDGAHDSQNVLFDSVCAFKLLKDSGIMIFDDYLWKGEDGNILKTPKLAIDSFVNIFSDKIYIIRKHLYQLYLIKTGNKSLNKFYNQKIKKIYNVV